ASVAGACGARAPRAEPYRRADDLGAQSNVTTARTNVRAVRRTFRHLDPFVVMMDNILDGHDGTRAARNDAAGGDLDRLAGSELVRRRPAGGDTIDDAERAGEVR